MQWHILRAVLTVNCRPKLSNGEVGDKPSILVHTVDDVGPLPRGVRLADGGAVVHVYVPEADPNTVLC